MHRKMNDILEKWEKNKNRQLLVLSGNRRTGKTFLVNDFAKHSDLIDNVFYFDCLREKDKLDDLFDSPNITARELIKSLEVMKNDRMHVQTSLIFFDNIQECPNMLEHLSSLYKEKRLHFMIVAGHDVHIPSYLKGDIEEHRLDPLSFEEFLEAYDKRLYKIYDKSDCQETFYHDKLLEAFRWYLISGGMPECVETFLETKNSNKILHVQREILNQYREDLSDGKRLLFAERVQASFDSIYPQLSKENPKFMYSTVPGGYEAKSLKMPVNKLIDDEIIIPVRETIHKDAFIPFFFDTGLLRAMAGVSAGDILHGRDFPFKKILYQNYVVQQLHQSFDLTYESTKHDLHYLLREKRADSNLLGYEVDVACDPKMRHRYQQNRRGDWIIFVEEPFARKGKYYFVSMYMVPKLQDFLHLPVT